MAQDLITLNNPEEIPLEGNITLTSYMGREEKCLQVTIQGEQILENVVYLCLNRVQALQLAEVLVKHFK